MKTKKETFKYIPSLDGVRAIAVLCVYFMHISYGTIKGGYLGVTLFFVLSGFLITSILQREFESTGKLGYTDFYIRRGLRLFPALFFCFILYILYFYLIPGHSRDNFWLTLTSSLFYFSNIVDSQYLGALGHLWSLSVEEHFYIFWPAFAVMVIFKKSLKTQLKIIVLIIILVTFLRIGIYHLNHTLADGYYLKSGKFVIDSYRFTFTRIDSILLGVILALIFRKKEVLNELRAPVLNVLLCFFLIVFALCVIFLDGNNVSWRYGGFVITNLLCLSIIIIAIKLPSQRLLIHPVLKWIGQRSYGLYIYHYIIFEAMEFLRKPNDFWNFTWITITITILTILITEFSFRYIEVPILKSKHKYQAIKVKRRLNNITNN